MENKMTNEKALQIMNHRKDICNKNFTFCSCDECEEECIYPNAINALEKQIPIKAIANKEDFNCSRCGRSHHIILNYCCWCGQKLKFEEE